MLRKNFSIIKGITVLLVVGMMVGCASTPKTPAGAHARAVKEAIPGPGGEEVVDIIRPSDIDRGQIPVTQLDPQGTYNLCQRIHFDYDKSDIKPEFTDCLDRLASFLSDNPSWTLIVEGHCDERGTNEYNMALGELRSNSTAQFLIERGISSGRIITRSWGEERPLELCHDESCWKENRRAEFFGVEQ